MKKCLFCGGEIPDTALFCVHCGKKQEAPAPEPEPAVTPAFEIPAEEPAQDYFQNSYDAAASAELGDEDAETTVLSPADLPAGWRKSMQEAFAQKSEPAQAPVPEPTPEPAYEPAPAPSQPQASPVFQPRTEAHPMNQEQFTPPPAAPQPQAPSFQNVNQQPPMDAPFAAPYQPGQQNQSFGGFNAQAPAQGMPQNQQAFQGMPQQAGPAPYSVPGEPPVKEKKKSKAGLWIGIGIAAVVVIAAVVLILLQPWKPKPVDVDLNPYASMTFSGNNGAGEFTFTFDEERFVDDYGSLIKWMSKSNETENPASREFYNYCVNGHFSAASGSLSNGDKISVIWDIDEGLSEYFNANVVSSSREFTVTGLNEIEAKDPFEGLIVEFDGISPYLYAYVDSSGVEEPFQYLQYKLDKESDLALGDTVTVTLLSWDDTDPTAYLEETYKVTPTQMTKTYTVSGAEAYITALSQIKAEDMDEFLAEAEPIFRDEEIPYLDDDITVDSITHVGDVFVTLKEPDYAETNNALFLVYKVDITITYTEEASAAAEGEESSAAPTEKTVNATYYWFVEYDEVIADADGNIDLAELYHYTPSNTVTFEGYTVYGYTSAQAFLDFFEMDEIADLYNVETTLTP